MTEAALDRPVWHSLVSDQAGVAQGNDLARRYRPDIHLFASARDATAEAARALDALIAPGNTIFLLQAKPIAPSPCFSLLKEASGVQMVAGDKAGFAPAPLDGVEIIRLGDADAPEMRALAELTEPGPFLENTHRLGRFLGIREAGRLVAMAGERMRFPGYVELSGVCAHPEVRGRGYARALSLAVSARIRADGDTPFLHAWTSNAPAIALYESLGFELRREVTVAVLERRPDS